MSYLPHQIEKGNIVADKVRSLGLCYLAGLPRSGKTRTALYALKMLQSPKVLWITKKQAVRGICSEVNAVSYDNYLHITNYEQVCKLNAKDYDLVVVDEAHNLATCGKPTQRIKDVRAVSLGKPVILLSGTPSVETALGLYHQFCISNHTPLPYKNFYEFFRHWGIPSPIWLQGRAVESYKKAKPELLPSLEQYFVTMTQEDAGITATAEDVVHRIPMSAYTLDLFSKVLDGVLGQYVFDSDAAIRTSLHQLEAGALLIDEQVVEFENTEFVDYIRTTFGDSPDVAIMCHFRSTREKVAKHLPNVHIYSSDGHSEGVDLSHYKHFVIANSGYSGAKFIQRRERGTRIGVTSARVVNHLVAAGQVSEKVYNAVAHKRDYNLQMFRGDYARARHTSQNT